MNSADSAAHITNVGNFKMDFNYGPVRLYNDSIYMSYDFTNTSYSNDEGVLQFYTNGISVANDLNENIEDTLNAGYCEKDWRYYNNDGYRLYQGILAFEYPQHPNQYFLLHSFYDTLSDYPWLYTHRTLVSKLDMTANTGHGKVISKDIVLIEDTLGFELSAARHGNGQDWWMLVQKRGTNCFYRVLVNKTGVHRLQDLTCSGDTMPANSICASCFSPDGSKYAYLCNKTGLNIYDFDRCSGELSNFVNVPIPIFIDSGLIGMGIAISANSRYLYVTATIEVYQFDLWASDIASSMKTIAVYDGFKLPFGSYFNTAQLAPDGKIYISSGNTEEDYHFINAPDNGGDLCDFRQHGLRLPNVSSCVPSFPNYRLGALPGSACDTLTGLDEVVRAEKEKILKVFPNPAIDVITVDYGFTDWNKADVNLEIDNELGQTVYQQTLPRYSGFQKIDVNRFVTGLYTAYIKRNNTVVAVSKFAKD